MNDRLPGRTLGHAHFINRRHFCRGLMAAGAGLAAPFGGVLARGPDKFDLSAHPEFETIIEGAKKEGGLLALTNIVYEGLKTLPELFRSYYGLPSSFRFEFVNKGGAQIAKQIQEEIAADRITADVVLFNVLATAKTLAERGELLEFEAPEYAAYAGLDKFGFNDRRFYVSDIYLLTNIAWNGDLVRRDFRSWSDLLTPELDKRISFVNARLSSSMALTYKSMRDDPAIGNRFFQELAKRRPTAFQRGAQCLEVVASGEFPVTIIGANRAYSMKRDLGVNVRQAFPAEGVAPIPVPAFALKRTSRPNASKLLLNFLRSRSAQGQLVNGEGWTTGRSDIPSPSPEFVPTLGQIKLLPVDNDLSEAELLTLGRDWEAIFGA